MEAANYGSAYTRDGSCRFDTGFLWTANDGTNFQIKK